MRNSCCFAADRGRSPGPCWYVRQVMRSGEAAHLLAAALIAVAMPLLLLDRLWSFVYSHLLPS
jgi:hypothetical protein